MLFLLPLLSCHSFSPMVYNFGHDLVVSILSMGNPCDMLWVTVSYLHLWGLYEFKCTGLMFRLIYFSGDWNHSGGLNLDPLLCSDCLQVCLCPSSGRGG